MRKTTLRLAVALSATILAGCGSSSDITGSGGATLTIPTNTFAGPTATSTNSSNTYAQLATSYAVSANSFSSAFFSAVQAANANHSGNTWSWTGTSNGLTITFTATQQSSGSYTWTWVVNGTNASTHVTYNNWTALSGTSSSDGKSGEWKVFDDNTTTLAADWTWGAATGTVGGVTGTLTTYNTAGTAVVSKLIVTNRTDKTGEVDVYSATVLVFTATWTATGSGQWTTYDSTTGAQTGSGTWT